MQQFKHYEKLLYLCKQAIAFLLIIFSKNILSSVVSSPTSSDKESEKESRKKTPNFYFVLPWHFKKEILNREKNIIKKGCKFISPLPELKVH